MISVQNVRKSFGDKLVVADVSFGVEPSKCFGIVGANGVGKTTLLSIVAGMLRPDSGDVIVDGSSLYNCSGDDYRKLVSQLSIVLQQKSLLYGLLSVKENLLLYAKLCGVEQGRVDQLIEMFELAEFADLKVNELSGGLQRKASIVRALVSNPKILILDEPLAFLDSRGVQRVSATLSELKTAGVTVLLTSHGAQFISSFTDAVLELDANVH